MTITRFTNEIKIYDSGILTTNGSGVVSHDTTDVINGEIIKIVYDKITFVDGGNLTLKTKTPIANAETIHTQTGLAADTIAYPVVALDGASAGDNMWGRYVVNDTLTIATTAGGDTKTVRVYIYYK